MEVVVPTGSAHDVVLVLIPILVNLMVVAFDQLLPHPQMRNDYRCQYLEVCMHLGSADSVVIVI